MAIELICIDVDGTLIRKDGTIPDENRKAIREAIDAGIHVAIATGRPYRGILHLLQSLDLMKADQFSITQNGALMQNNETGEVVESLSLTMEDVRDIESFVAPYKIPFSYLDVEGFYSTSDPIDAVTQWDADVNKMKVETRATDTFPKDHLFAKVLLHGMPDTLDPFDQHPPEALSRFYSVRSQDRIFEIMHPKANKGEGVRLLAEYLHIPLGHVMVLADGMNDLEMMQVVGWPVAMENAVQEIKDAAREMTKSNEAAGVAYAIRKYALHTSTEKE